MFLLPFSCRFDVPTARESVAQLARSQPDARIVFTVALVTPSGGIEQEKEMGMRAEEASALLATVGVDQKVRLMSTHGSRGPMIDSRHMFLIGVFRPSAY